VIGDTCYITLTGKEGDTYDALYFFTVLSYDMGLINARKIYRVLLNNDVGGTFDVKCTTNVYDTVSKPMSFGYNLKTSSSSITDDTLRLLTIQGIDTFGFVYDTLPLIKAGTGYWVSNFQSNAISMYVKFVSIMNNGAYFRLTENDKDRNCIWQ
jgi:hypothetical protein